MSDPDAPGDADGRSGGVADEPGPAGPVTDGSEPDPSTRSDGGFGRERPPRHDGRLHSDRRQGTPYTESQVIMPTVKIVTPFAFTYGLFVTFHGAGSPGGGFQGGAIVAAVVFMIAFAFGIESTRQWLANTVVVGLAVGGTLVFAGIGLASVALGGAFLQYELLPIPDPVKYGMEGVEILGIGTIVAGVLMGLFFVLANGFSDDEGFGDSDAFDDEVADRSGRRDAARPASDGAEADAAAGDGAGDPTAADGGDRR